MRALRAYPMLLMLLLLCAGVLGMHTLGHQPGHLPMHQTHAATAIAPAMSDDCCAVVGPVLSGHAPMGPMTDPTSVCLAILSALTLAIVFLLLRSGSGGVERLLRQLRALVPAGRGPPGARRVGLLLADLAVLRN